MKIKIKKNGMKLGQLIKFIGSGYLCGLGVIYAIAAILMLITAPFSSMSENEGFSLLLVVMIPVILAIQAVIFSVVVAFGHWVFRKFSSIEIEPSE